MRRVFQSLAVLVAVAIAIIAVNEINMRWDAEDDVAMGPTVPPSAAELPTPEPDTPLPRETPGEQTDIPRTPRLTAEVITPSAAAAATDEPTAQPTEEPTEEPAAEPSVAPSVPTPTARSDAMPHTGGGAVGGGLALMAVAACVHLVLRRSY